MFNRMNLKPYLHAMWMAVLTLVLTTQAGKAQQIENQLASIMEQYRSVGLAVAVVKDNKLIYTHSMGWKDMEKQIPLQEDNLFRIASISKSFSATAIMHLVESGKVRLDDKVSDLIGFEVKNPRYPDTDITLQMLLSHTSSINDKGGYFSLDIIDPEKNPEWEKKYNDYEPGSNYEYCNLNFNMIGAIIERLTGTRFDVYIQDLILKPLGLYGGYCVDSLDQDRFARIYSYQKKTDTFKASPGAYRSIRDALENYTIGYDAPVFSPTGGMKISAPDLARYMMMHMNYGKLGNTRIIRKKSAKKMQAPFTETTAENWYGFAIRISDTLIPGVRMTGHTGSAYGLYSSMFFDPEKKFGIVVITNGSKPDATDGFSSVLKPVTLSLYNHFIKE